MYLGNRTSELSATTCRNGPSPHCSTRPYINCRNCDVSPIVLLAVLTREQCSRDSRHSDCRHSDPNEDGVRSSGGGTCPGGLEQASSSRCPWRRPEKELLALCRDAGESRSAKRSSSLSAPSLGFYLNGGLQGMAGKDSRRIRFPIANWVLDS